MVEKTYISQRIKGLEQTLGQHQQQLAQAQQAVQQLTHLIVSIKGGIAELVLVEKTSTTQNNPIITKSKK